MPDWCVLCRDFGKDELHTDHWPHRRPTTTPEETTTHD